MIRGSVHGIFELFYYGRNSLSSDYFLSASKMSVFSITPKTHDAITKTAFPLIDSNRTQNSRRQSVSRRRSGFLLIIVIVMLAIATLMMTGLASQSLREASVALQEEREMRNRWAVTSIRRLTLQSAPAAINSQNQKDISVESLNSNPPVAWRDFELAGQKWRAVVADESAKLNLLKLSQKRPSESLVNSANGLITGQGQLQIDSRTQQTDLRSLYRWERWFIQTSGRTVTDPAILAEATQKLTLWGDGRLNLRRCHSEALDVLWRELFGRSAPEALHEARMGEASESSGAILKSLALRESELNLAREWMAEDSSTYSLWLFCPSDRRIRPALFVKWGQNEIVAQQRGYEY